MPTNHHPGKDLVRAYLKRRAHDPKPPPGPEEIRRQLGWGAMPPNVKKAGTRS